MIDVTMPKEGYTVTAESFSWKLNWPRIWEARDEDEGTYLLRTNLPECDPKTLWKKYMIQGEIEYAPYFTPYFSPYFPPWFLP